MKRDLELVRQLLESIAGSRKLEANKINAYDLELMENASLIENAIAAEGHATSSRVPVVRITEYGQEFLAASRNESAWSYLRKVSAHMGGMALFTAREILLKLAKPLPT